MRSFTGEVAKRKIDLRGKSRSEETREEVLERTRLERERRKQAKLEQKSATVIQSHWRRWLAGKQARTQLSQTWASLYGPSGERLEESSLQLTQPCLPLLLLSSGLSQSTHYIEQRQSLASLVPDIQRLTAVCRLLLQTVQQKGSLMELVTPSSTKSAAMDVDNSDHAISPVSRLIYLLSVVVSHCVSALSALTYWEPVALSELMRSPRPAVSSLLNDSKSQLQAALLTETLLLVVSPDSWSWLSAIDSNLNRQSDSGKPWTAATASAAIMTKLLLGTCNWNPARIQNLMNAAKQQPSLFKLLARLLLLTQQSQSAMPTSPTASSKTYAEQLTTQLCVRALGLKQGTQLVLELQQPQQGLYHLLCVPNLWSTVPSLSPLIKHLTRLSSASLAALPPHQIARQPSLYLLTARDGSVYGPAGAAAALLGNITEGALKLLSLHPPFSPASTHAAIQVCTVINMIFSILPPQLLKACKPSWHPTAVSAVSVASMDEDEQENQLSELDATISRSRDSLGDVVSEQPRLAWPDEEMLPAGVVMPLQALTEVTGRQLLRAFISNILPINSTSQTPFISTQYLSSSYTLCQLISQLSAIVSNRTHLYLALALSTDLIPRMWFSVIRPLRLHELSQPGSPASNGNFPAAAPTSPTFSQTQAQQGSQSGVGDVQGLQSEQGLASLLIFSEVFHAHLGVATTEEFFSGTPLPLSELYDPQKPAAGLISLLKDRLWSLLWTRDVINTSNLSNLKRTETNASLPASFSKPSSSSSTMPAISQQSQVGQVALMLRQKVFARVAGQLYGALYDRNSSAGKAEGPPMFCPTTAFHASVLGADRFAQEAAAARAAAGQEGGTIPSGLAGKTDMGSRIWQVLRHAPALVPFEERARLFQAEAEAAREQHLESEIAFQQQQAMMGVFTPPKHVSVRRSQLLYDGYDKLGQNGAEALKGRVRISFVDDEGLQEAGVDGGGLFKEFLEGVIKEGFGGEHGLFAANAQAELYPSPSAYAVVPEAHALLSFLGAMLGKALWEGILVELPLARFFLKKLRGSKCDLRDLRSLDQQLYLNLLSLKSYQGDWSDLSLTFTATHEVYGAHQEVELKPGGSQIQVNADNVAEYIARVADFRLNIEPRRAIAAFNSGFHSMVTPEWVTLFNEAELQMLISGREEGRVDINDLRAHTHYAGGYHEDHPVIHLLWQTLSTLTSQQQHDFLRFVTACSRAPLLGFKYLEPQLCVQMACGVLDEGSTQRLPTAATCMNLLKLPPYRTVKQMHDKLVMAITGTQTFDLS